MNSNGKMITGYISLDAYKKFKLLCAEEGFTMAGKIRLMIMKLLKEYEKNKYYEED